MKEKKGFTLIELLGVIVIIGTVSIVVFAMIPNLLSGTNDKDYKRFLNDLFLATESYVKKYSPLNNDGDIEYVTIKQLLNKDLIEDKIVNPNTKNEITDTDSIKVVAKQNSSGGVEYNYEFIRSYKDYVQNGLIIHYDTSNNTNNGYDQNSTTWYDLSQNGNNGAISGAIWKDGGLYFDGVDDWVNLGEQNNSNTTIELVFKVQAAVSSSQIYVLVGNFENGGIGTYASLTNMKILAQEYMGSSYTNISNSKAIEFDKMYSLSSYYSNNLLSINLSSNKNFKTVTGELGFPKNNTVLALGANPTGNQATEEYMHGYIYSVRIYNRQLTDDEVKQNYELDKERFGIGE